MLKTIPAEARWERSHLATLVEALASTSGVESTPLREPPCSPGEEEDLDAWIEAACGHLHLEAEPIRTSAKEVAKALEHAAPALLALPEDGFAGLLKIRGGWAHLLTTDLRRTKIPTEALRDILRSPAETPFEPETDRLLNDCCASFSGNNRAKRALLRERAGSSTILLGWQMRESSGSSFARQVIHAGLGRRLSVFAATYAAEYTLSLSAWWLLAQAALGGRFDAALMTAWVAMMASGLLFRVWKASSSEAVAVGLGGLLKQRLIAGAVCLDPDSVRHQGGGGMLARVIESETLESLALGGGLAALVAPIELLFAIALLWFGAGGMWHAALLVAWIALLGMLVWHDFGCRDAWMRARFRMTDDLVERMNGHRTRLAQEDPDRWHAGEDRALAEYLDRSGALDRSLVRINTLAPRMWLLCGLAALAPAFLRSSSPASLAVSIAAVLLAQRSLRSLSAGLGQLSGAFLAWRQIGPFFRAAGNPLQSGTVSVLAPEGGQVVLEARNLIFRYREHGDAVLRGCNVTVNQGDWIMLEGASGNGKSTLASLVAGLRTPESGLLLAGGLDRRTLGEVRWRKRVAYAPQAHENHVFSGSLAFNLLMGRAWPPRREDLADAQALCRDLGLGDLVSRMPAGLDQIVGESGWRLSEGERTRIFLGRALLSRGDLLVLDESLSALDPESLASAHQSLHRRAPSVLMVAHP